MITVTTKQNKTKFNVGDTLSSNNYGDFIILGDGGRSGHKGYTKMTKIKFIDTGTITSVRTDDMIRGKIKDNYAKTICGVACIGNAKRKDYEREYRLWHHMISRCYNKKQIKDKPIYEKCEVHKDWLCFEYFLDSMPQIEGYEDWVIKANYELDKDTKVPNTQLYSLDTCRFIPRSKNRGAMTKARIKAKCSPIFTSRYM